VKKWIWQDDTDGYLRYAVRHGATLRMMAHDLGWTISQVKERIEILKERKRNERKNREGEKRDPAS